MVLTRLLFFIFQQIKNVVNKVKNVGGGVLNVTYSSKNKRFNPPLQHLPKYHLSKKFVIHQCDCWVMEPSHWQRLISSHTLAELSYLEDSHINAWGAGKLERCHSFVLCDGVSKQADRFWRWRWCDFTVQHLDHGGKCRSSLLFKITWKVFVLALCQICVQLSQSYCN